MRTSTAGMRMT